MNWKNIRAVGKKCYFCRKPLSGKLDEHHIEGKKNSDKKVIVHYKCHHNYHEKEQVKRNRVWEENEKRWGWR